MSKFRLNNNKGIVPTNVNYNSRLMDENIEVLKKRYSFLEVSTIGRSVSGRPIHVIKLGKGKKEVFYNASMHANEWITSVLLMKFVENFCRALVNNSRIFGYLARNIFNNTSIYIVPMCNPDGVDLVTGALETDSIEFLMARGIAETYPDIPFPDGWKANVRGTDLNLQFPAGWEEARAIKYSQGFIFPAPRDYVGDGPLVEPEALAIAHFTKIHNFRLILTYHTQGKEIYWQFLNYAPEEAFNIGQKFAKVSGYNLSEVPYNSSFAGYKDWFLQEYRKPGYTIEAGGGSNPLPIARV